MAIPGHRKPYRGVICSLTTNILDTHIFCRFLNDLEETVELCEPAYVSYAGVEDVISLLGTVLI